MHNEIKTLQIHIPEALNAEAEMIFRSAGLTADDAVRLFFQQSVNYGGIPFLLLAKVPNKETLLAMQDTAGGNSEHFASAEAMFASWKQEE